MNNLNWRPCTIIVLAIAAGCSSDSGIPTQPPVGMFRLEAVTSVRISGVVDTDVSETPRVRVVDQRGNPVRGVVVSFQTEDGPLATTAPHTTADGTASPTRWRLGKRSGSQWLSANIAGLEPFVFTADAAAGPVTQISEIGDEQASRPGSKVPNRLSVRLADKFNNPVPGENVAFTIVSGEGTLEHGTSMTGSDGTASPGAWTLGPTLGPQHVKAGYVSRTNHWDVFFTAHACDNIGPSGCNDAPALCASPTNCGEIVFVSSRDGQAEIYSVSRDGTGLTRLTNNPAGDWDPAWSHDGKRIAFVSDRSAYPEIYVMNADGSNVVRRTFWANWSTSPSWSPDGKRIVFSAGSTDGPTLWSLSSEAGGPAPTRFFPAGKEPPGNPNQPAWAPAGDRLAFTYSLDDDLCDIATTDGGGSQVTQITASSGCYTYPSWSRTGSRMTVAFYDSGKALLGIFDAVGSTPKPLISTGLFTESSWSPDDQLIAFASGTASSRNLRWIKADGTAFGTIVTNGWSPDWRR